MDESKKLVVQRHQMFSDYLIPLSLRLRKNGSFLGVFGALGIMIPDGRHSLVTDEVGGDKKNIVL